MNGWKKKIKDLSKKKRRGSSTHPNMTPHGPPGSRYWCTGDKILLKKSYRQKKKTNFIRFYQIYHIQDFIII